MHNTKAKGKKISLANKVKKKWKRAHLDYFDMKLSSDESQMSAESHTNEANKMSTEMRKMARNRQMLLKNMELHDKILQNRQQKREKFDQDFNAKRIKELSESIYDNNTR